MHVREAAETLMLYCDGAFTRDGVGYNKSDRTIVDDLLSQKMTDKQCQFLKNILIKYRKQLLALGIDVNLLYVTPERENGKSQNKIVQNTSHKIFINNDSINVSLTYGAAHFFEVKDAIKPFFIWDSVLKLWHLRRNLTIDDLKNLRKTLQKISEKCEISEEIYNFLAEKSQINAEKSEKFEINNFVEIDRLYKFQRDGIARSTKMKNVLIADEMGLGKTVQAIGTILAKSLLPCLVICPASLKTNWEREIKKWSEKTVYVLNGKNKNIDFNMLKKYDFVVINYDILERFFNSEERKNGGKKYTLKNDFKALGFKGLIVDESHYIKNPKARRSKFTKAISKVAGSKILLTGTPILNRPVELAEQLDVLGVLEPVFGGFWKFVNRYCNATRGYWGWDFSGASNLDELNEKLAKYCMIRRLKEEVLDDLPKKCRNTVFLTLKNVKFYEDAEADVRNYISQKFSGEEKKRRLSAAERAEILTKITYLKRAALECKLSALVEWVENWFESNPDKKLVLFVNSYFAKDKLLEKFSDEAVVLMGDVSQRQRQEAVDRFQSDNSIKLFIGSIKAAGVGLTLTASDTVVFAELDWNFAIHQQAEDRVHRIGQKSGSVSIFYLLGAGTVEEQIYRLIMDKKEVVEATIDGGLFESL